MNHFLLAIASLLLAALMAMPAAAGPAQGQIPAEDDSGLPDDLMAGLRQRSQIYRRAILRFSAREELLEENLKPETGQLNSRHEAVYRYLLQVDTRDLKVSEYREILSRAGVPVRSSPAVLQSFMPPPYLWATLFAAENESLFRYQLLGPERRGVTDTLVIAFDGLLAFDLGHRPAEWSGRVWIDRDRLVPLHLEAAPARQEVTLEAEMDRYRKAFRLGGLRLRSRPTANELSVEFLVSRFGLSFPSQTIWKRQVLDPDGTRLTTRYIRHSFLDYRFINVRTDEIIGDVIEVEPGS
ncbi:MAG: hypothetical protein O7A07_04295 [Acidobacteria bacterium]|nr:hypothetical protein [Acidobacteriota bacterium]